VPFLTHIACTSYEDRMVCPPGATQRSPSSGVVTDLEIRVTYTAVIDGKTTPKTQGDNRLLLEFAPSAMELDAYFKTPKGNITTPLEIYKAPWVVAHEPDLVDTVFRISDWDRVGHPLMFKKIYKGSRGLEGVKYTDSTEFQFTHTPDTAP